MKWQKRNIYGTPYYHLKDYPFFNIKIIGDNPYNVRINYQFEIPLRYSTLNETKIFLLRYIKHNLINIKSIEDAQNNHIIKMRITNIGLAGKDNYEIIFDNSDNIKDKAFTIITRHINRFKRDVNKEICRLERELLLNKLKGKM